MYEQVEHFRLAGSIIAARWPSSSLQAELGAALRHRCALPGEPELTLQARVRRRPAAAASGLIVDERELGFSVFDPLTGSGQGLDWEQASGWMEFAEERNLPLVDQAAPFRHVLQRWLAARGTQVLHGGAVGLPEKGAVLLAASSGGGKSNTMLACLASSLSLLGEDYVAVDGAAEPRVWSLYSSAKLYPNDLARYPDCKTAPDLGRDSREEKALLQLGGTHAARFADGLPLRGILVLRVVPREDSAIVPADRGAAVKALLTHPLMILPAARRGIFEFITGLVQRLPVYRLELGRDPRQIAAVIEEFLRR